MYKKKKKNGGGIAKSEGLFFLCEASAPSWYAIINFMPISRNKYIKEKVDSWDLHLNTAMSLEFMESLETFF